MHIQMLSTVCFNLDQSKILSFGNGLKAEIVWLRVDKKRMNVMTLAISDSCGPKTLSLRTKDFSFNLIF